MPYLYNISPRISIWNVGNINNYLPVLSEPDRLKKFQIRLGSSDQVQNNPLCWKQDSPVLAFTKTFRCESGPVVGRYLSVDKDGTGLRYNRYILTLCEVVVIGGMVFVIFLGRGIVVVEWGICIR